jgi:DNA (cytosine-5)-methyltransferase 1
MGADASTLSALGTTAVSARPVAVDLFAGAGGFALGFEQAGFDVVAAVEYDPIHAAAHEFNFPRTKVLCANASSLEDDELFAAVATGTRLHGREDCDVDVVFGGPPCQGFSTGGKQVLRDERNLLIFDFLRLTLALRPRFFVLENVPPLKNYPDADYHGEKLLDRLIAAFEEADYRVRPSKVLNASCFGVPQDRRRLILIGAREGEDLPDYPAASTSPVPKRPSDRPRPWEVGGARVDHELSAGPTVWDALSDLPDPESFPELVEFDEVEISEARGVTMERAASAYARRLRGLDPDAEDLSYPRLWNRLLLTSSRRTTHTASTIERFGKTDPGSMEETSRYYRLHRDGLCSTIRAGTGYERGSFMAPRPIHPAENRVITVREAARLHSFPDWFRFHYSKWHGFRQIGNSLPPLLGRALASELRKTMGLELTKPAEELELGDVKLLRFATIEATEYFQADDTSVPSHKLRHRPKRSQPKRSPTSDLELAA